MARTTQLKGERCPVHREKSLERCGMTASYIMHNPHASVEEGNFSAGKRLHFSLKGDRIKCMITKL